MRPRYMASATPHTCGMRYQELANAATLGMGPRM